jgi:hypothetical protein
MPETWPSPSNRSSSSGVIEARKKIRIFATLPEGWHYGDGIAAAPRTEFMALRLQAEALTVRLFQMDAFPGIKGEIRLVIYEPNYLEFTIESDGTITFLEEQNGQETDYQPNLSLEEALLILNKAGRQLWGSFASTTGTTIGINTDFRPLPSATQQTIPVFR